MQNLSLIANSGIQYYSTEITIDYNDGFKVLFHEWFNEDTVQQDLEFAYCLPNSQKVYRWNDLINQNCIDNIGKLNYSEVNILANPKIIPLEGGENMTSSNRFYNMKFSDKNCQSTLKAFFKKWIPIPYLELDANYETKQGPYNWCRMQIVPKDMTDSKLEAYLLFAFDTRALYKMPPTTGLIECPYFESNTITNKEFRLCDNKRLLFDFCQNGHEWVISYLMSLVHGVTDLDLIKSDSKGNKYYFLAAYMMLIEYLSTHIDLPIITLHRDRDVEKINVEMIIDIGNSRTAALLYEQDLSKVEMLRLQNFEKPIMSDGHLNRTEESFDMGVAFQKVDFGAKPHINSKQFIWPSMVRLGIEANHLTHQTISLNQGDELYSTYSSPKRYLWDNKIRREEWRCVSKDKQGKNEPVIIEGISNYFENDGKIDTDGLGYGSHYSRRTLMTFAFMEILAQANVQINSYDYRAKLGKPSTPRILDKIILTCPTGMSKNEQLALHGCLKDALFILQTFYKNNDDSYIAPSISIIPDLDKKQHTQQWIFDEATCSHFVYLYGLFTHTYQNCSNEFFNMYGKKRTNENNEICDSIRIGSLDIGAGTTDIMICQYNYNSNIPSRLKPIPIFWDSFDTAGDDMLRKLISNIILQGRDGLLQQEMLQRGWEKETYLRTLFNFVGSNHNTQSFVDRVLRRDFNLQVLVPLMYYLLNLHSKEIKVAQLSYDEVFGQEPPSDEVLDAFKKHFGIELKEIKWQYDYDVLSQYIERSMDDLLSKVAVIMYAHDCDIILLSGRPTSLKPIKDTFLRYFPVAPNRLIILNKHRVGTWYSYTDEFGKINNSKSIVPLGAMLGYLASSAGGFNNFSLDLSVLGEKLTPTTEYFLINDTKANSNKSFITPSTSSGHVRENSFPIYIGCKQFDLPLYPIRPFYVLDFNEDGIIKKIKTKYKDLHLTPEVIQRYYNDYKTKLLLHSPLKFTIEREDYRDEKEKLKITEVENNLKETLSIDDFQLSIQSLNDPDCYWLDSGAFEINIMA